jgi:hypothetical protein
VLEIALIKLKEILIVAKDIVDSCYLNTFFPEQAYDKIFQPCSVGKKE